MSQRLGFGKYAGFTYANVEATNKPYCAWVLKNHEKLKVPAMSDFAHWLKNPLPPPYDSVPPRAIKSGIPIVPLNHFGHVLHDNDVIQITVSDLPPSESAYVTFVITVPCGLWAKQIRVVADRVYELQSDRSNTLTVHSHHLTEAHVEFWKPKFLGLNTHLYNLIDLGGFVGKRVEFHWVRD